MDELRRHRTFYHGVLPLIRTFSKWKFNYEYDSLKDETDAYLLLANHNLELDPLLIGTAAGRHIYFVASEHLLRKGAATKLLMHFVNPIIHMKGRQGAKTVKQMLRTLQEGQSVCIFPEGNRSFNGVTMDMQSSIARVAKKAKVKLITYRVEGGYFTQPRWSTNLRRGKIRGRLVNIYTPDQLSEMSDEQISEAIIKDLHEDAYETQKKERIAFKGKDLALGLESTIFACPECGKIGTLHSQKDRFFCDCGFSAVYDVFGDLKTPNGETYTVTQLDLMQKNALEKAVQNYDGEEPLFEDKVTFHYISNNHELIRTEDGSLKAYPDHLDCAGERLDFDEIEGMAIYSRSALIMHHKKFEGHLEVKSDIRFSALKYLYLYNLIKGF